MSPNSLPILQVGHKLLFSLWISLTLSSQPLVISEQPFPGDLCSPVICDLMKPSLNPKTRLRPDYNQQYKLYSKAQRVPDVNGLLLDI